VASRFVEIWPCEVRSLDSFAELDNQGRRMMKTLSPETLLLVSLAIGLVPILIALGTCYLKFSIVLSLLRSGFGTQQAPSSSLVMALSMVMSLSVMQPVIHQTLAAFNQVTIADVREGAFAEVLKRGEKVVAPWREFLLAHAGEREVKTFQRLATNDQGTPVDEKISLSTAMAAFVLSEIKKGFVIAFILLIPFFAIDLIVGNLLVALGLTMMSPNTVSLPLKILLFVSTDGWLLLAKGLITSYR
jgi:type III secretory pathway component EscR